LKAVQRSEMAPVELDDGIKADAVVTDEKQSTPVLPFCCEVCSVRFQTRNKLFKHIKNSPLCAKDGGYAEREESPNYSRAGGYADQSCLLPVKKIAPNDSNTGEATQNADAEAKKKKKDKVKSSEPGRLNLETRPGQYRAELAAKVASIQTLFQSKESDTLPKIEVFASPPEHFRMKVEFDIWHDEQGPNYVMFNGSERVKVNSFPMGSRVITDVFMPVLLKELRASKILSWMLFQVNFHTTLSGESMVSLLYHTEKSRAVRKARHDAKMVEQAHEDYVDPMPGDVEEDFSNCKINDEWAEEAATLRSTLSSAADGASVSIIGRVKGKQRVLGRDYVEERFTITGAGPSTLCYQQPEGFFSQPNGAMAQHMLSWARAVALDDGQPVESEEATKAERRKDDLLELYCGNGNFSIALARCFRNVLATELVKELVHSATVNAETNGVTNIQLARVSAEELAEALDGGRQFARMAHLRLEELDLKTVLVDPPRAGLGLPVSKYLSRFPRIIYISCNPVTMHEDLKTLRETHSISRLATFDQFPYTEHLEMGMLLVRCE